jgi:hypothetical protein
VGSISCLYYVDFLVFVFPTRNTQHFPLFRVSPSFRNCPPLDVPLRKITFVVVLMSSGCNCHVETGLRLGNVIMCPNELSIICLCLVHWCHLCFSPLFVFVCYAFSVIGHFTAE